METTYAIMRGLAFLFLAGDVVQATDVSAGLGRIIDWREVRCGEEIASDLDPFDTAALFVALVGWEAAGAAMDAKLKGWVS